MRNPKLSPGFTLVELVAAIAIIGALAAVAFGFLSSYKAPIESVKIEQDVATLNRAVAGYQINGGSLDSVTDLQDVNNDAPCWEFQLTLIASLARYVDQSTEGIYTRLFLNPVECGPDSVFRLFCVCFLRHISSLCNFPS